VTVGPKGLAEGQVEFLRRATGNARSIDLVKAGRSISETVFEERAMGPQV
jgi:hypothetical protein